MAVIEVVKTFEQKDFRQDADGRRTFTDGYDVLLAPESGVHPITMIMDAQESGLLPKRGIAHDELAGYYCRGLNGGPSGGPYRYVFTVPFADSEGANSDDPLLNPPSIEWGGENVEESIDTDKDLLAIANTAGVPFDPPIVVPYADLTLTYEYNVPATFFSVATLLSYANKTNSNDWTGVCEAGEALMDGAPRLVYVYPSNDTPAYYRTALRIKFRRNKTEAEEPGVPEKNAWKRRVLNAGFHTLVDGVPTVAVDANGLPMNTPILLDIDGQQTDLAYWKWFRVYDEADFSALGIAIP